MVQHQCKGNAIHGAKGLPLLKDGGSIILNGSVASVKGTAAFGVYAASKAALRSFVRTWTTDLKNRHIRSMRFHDHRLQFVGPHPKSILRQADVSITQEHYILLKSQKAGKGRDEKAGENC
jgi:hypothetical protein